MAILDIPAEAIAETIGAEMSVLHNICFPILTFWKLECEWLVRFSPIKGVGSLLYGEHTPCQS